VIEAALAMVPGDPRIRGTRGQVLAELGRWKDALADLEAATADSQAGPGEHLALAKVYDHLNNPDLAAEQRKKAAGKPGTRP
jgi:uncharacterized protein HemY